MLPTGSGFGSPLDVLHNKPLNREETRLNPHQNRSRIYLELIVDSLEIS